MKQNLNALEALFGGGLLSPKIPTQPSLGLFNLLATGRDQYGLREDGSFKGNGFFGAIPRPDGNFSTELSIGVDMDGRERLMPLLTPNLSRLDINHLLRGGEPTDAIVNKAVEFARQRMQANKPLFADDNERYPLPLLGQP